jgi:DNA-binding MarR family transcriptional regulator
MSLRLIPQIHRATHRIGLYLADLREFGLSQGEAHILAHLAKAAPATINDLHRGLAHKRSTLTSILDRLADRGLITREVGASDRRTVRHHAHREGTSGRPPRAPAPRRSGGGDRARVTPDDVRVRQDYRGG